LPIGPFPDFNACVAHMTKPKEEGGGGYDEETARKVCGKMKAELEESFSWAGDIRPYPGARLIRGEAIHPIKTFHPYEWPQLRVFLEDELEKSAETLVGKPLFLDHWRPLNGKVLGARYEDGALEYVAELNDPDILQMIRDGQIKYASIQFEWKILENVDGLAPRGINYQHLSLLKDMQPGDPQTSVNIWESIARQLKEARRSPAGLNPKPEEEKTRLSELKEAEWDMEYINNLDDDCFAYIEPGGEKDEQGKTTPRSLRHFPYKDAQGNLSPDHVRNGLTRLGQELGDWATADAKAQIKKKLCAAAKALEIESEVCDLKECKETIEALKGQVKVLESQNAALQEELKKKPVSEAIISSSVTPPGDILREIKRLLPERPPMAWGHHYHQLWLNLRNIVKRHELGSS